MSDTEEEAWTVLRLLEWTTDFFKKRGSPSARLDAEVLLAHARDCERIQLYTSFAEIPTEEEKVAFREMVRRRGEGMPVAQLVGYKEFYSLKFRVTEHVLIPRPETEHLVIEALDCAKLINKTDAPLQIADVGTGSGAIAIALAVALPNAQFTAIDQSSEALKIATWNAEKHKVDSRIRFIESDLLAEVQSPAKFDIICSNPPYVSEAEYEDLLPSVRDFEPRQALVSGPDGTEIIKRLLGESYDRLNPGGRLIIELSPMIAEACAELVGQISELEDLRFIKDLAGHKRILSIARKH
ncbi:peptide chain release factor N(5)-glutamine methyltransferase [Planctomycetes bacterium K23_9]|uniref:Release factor glutamine methyltransferase n=1 Tax=Stieleria marina TaxID=1930275 RepID=A0A517NP66_9BACT|nr:Release factor glutamine methyltransferase [Planctomycetes bacterium K23_9]